MNDAAYTGPLLVLSDLDDSFLARDKSVPAQNLEALDLMAQRGVTFVPCTGRPVAGVPQALMDHPATRLAVGSNGGVIVDARMGEVLHRSTMSCEVVRAIYERVRHLDVTFDIFVPGHVYAERRRFDAMLGFGIDEANLRTIRSIREPREATVPEMLREATGVEKVTMYWATERDRDEAYEALASFAEVEPTTSHPRNIEFMATGTSKGSALVWICRHLGIEVARSVAFGDSANDIPMLEAAGTGVAVGNADERTKAAADRVCATCDEGGVGSFLQVLLA